MTDEQTVRAYITRQMVDGAWPPGITGSFALAALDRMAARIAELEGRGTPWGADGAHCPTCDCVEGK